MTDPVVAGGPLTDRGISKGWGSLPALRPALDGPIARWRTLRNWTGQGLICASSRSHGHRPKLMAGVPPTATPSLTP